MPLVPRLGAPDEAVSHADRQLTGHVSVQVRGQKGRVDTREHFTLARQPGCAELRETQPKSRLLAG